MSSTQHHLYVHVPFCRLVCAYCDFVTVGGRAGDIPRYADALVRELALRPAPDELRTIYFGGGTPSLLDPEQVDRIVRAALDRWQHAALEEVTLEANPSRREAPDWAGLRAAGVTRISVGVQSLRDQELAALARGHAADEARDAYAAARRAGFESVSIDLIYGIGGQSIADWRAGLAAAVALGPDHVSCYALQLALAPDEWAAPPRPGALRWRGRMARRQDDGLAAEQYRLAEEILDGAGYRHYELSSWA
ncbi:MAG: radical SAM protein, partial [Candidatus Limnocylindria bacterium]